MPQKVASHPRPSGILLDDGKMRESARQVGSPPAPRLQRRSASPRCRSITSTATASPFAFSFRSAKARIAVVSEVNVTREEPLHPTSAKATDRRPDSRAAARRPSQDWASVSKSSTPSGSSSLQKACWAGRAGYAVFYGQATGGVATFSAGGLAALPFGRWAAAGLWLG